jgi:hypothetical protein
MARRAVLAALCALVGVVTGASSIEKSSTDFANLFNGKHPLQGVEVNGLFNPMQRLVQTGQ